MFLKILSLLILISLVALIVLAILMLGPIPGKMAKKRNHPQSDAILICGWIGIFTGGLLWIIALIWAYSKPLIPQITELEQRLTALEKKIKKSE